MKNGLFGSSRYAGKKRDELPSGKFYVTSAKIMAGGRCGRQVAGPARDQLLTRRNSVPGAMMSCTRIRLYARYRLQCSSLFTGRRVRVDVLAARGALSSSAPDCDKLSAIARRKVAAGADAPAAFSVKLNIPLPI